MGAFGEKLRKQREQRGIELDAISNTTKISTRMLRALEDEHFDQLPGGVFNKGFVRAYARHVGLDEQEAVTDYLAALRESQVQAQQILPNFRAPAPDRDYSALAAARVDSGRLDATKLDPGKLDAGKLDAGKLDAGRTPAQVLERNRHTETRAAKLSSMQTPSANPPAERFPKKYPAGILVESADKPPIPIPWEKLAAALLLVALALAFWSYRRHRPQNPASTSQSQSASIQSPVPFSTAGPTPPDHAIPAEKPSSTESAGTKAKATTAESSTASTASSTSPTTSKSSAIAPPASSPTASPNSADDDASSSATSTTTTATKQATKTSAPPASKPLPTFTLLIRATETSWVSITADGNPVAAETLIAPAGTSVRATREIVVRAGNAFGVSFLLNGKSIPTQGNEGEVKTFTFDSTGIRDSPPAPAPATNQ